MATGNLEEPLFLLASVQPLEPHAGGNFLRAGFFCDTSGR